MSTGAFENKEFAVILNVVSVPDVLPVTTQYKFASGALQAL
jgi:hypothetical protein